MRRRYTTLIASKFYLINVSGAKRLGGGGVEVRNNQWGGDRLGGKKSREGSGLGAK